MTEAMKNKAARLLTCANKNLGDPEGTRYFRTAYVVGTSVFPFQHCAEAHKRWLDFCHAMDHPLEWPRLKHEIETLDIHEAFRMNVYRDGRIVHYGREMSMEDEKKIIC